MLYSIAAVLVLVLDQAVKFWTVRNIAPQAIDDACVNLIPGVIHMTNVQNYGAAFSILENARWVLVAVSAIFIIGIIVLVSMDIIHTKFGRWTAILVMAGALGNCIDRVLLGYVVDMFEFELFNFAVFNVADIFITVCGILFCIHVIFYREPEAERNAVPRPVKQTKSRRAARKDDYYDDEEEDDEEEAPRSSRGRKAKKAPAAGARRSAARAKPARDDDFDDWDDEDDYLDEPAPKKRPARQEEPAPAPKPAARRRTAPALEDDWDDFTPDISVRRSAAPAAPAKPSKPAPAAAASKKEEDDGLGFDEYSLEDILSEFRDL